MTAEELFQTLRAFEEELHRPEVRRDSSGLRALLHADFEEIGRSGRRYTRDDVLRELSASSGPMVLSKNADANFPGYRTVSAGETNINRGADSLTVRSNRG
jgi:hypothetical protein